MGEEQDIESQEDRITTLACQHIFHYNCLANWIERGYGRFDKCPQCRGPINVEILNRHSRLRVVEADQDTSTNFYLHAIEGIFVFWISSLIKTSLNQDEAQESEEGSSKPGDLSSVQVLVLGAYASLWFLNALSYSCRPRPNARFYPPLTRVVVNTFALSLRGFRAIKRLFSNAVLPELAPSRNTPVQVLGRPIDTVSRSPAIELVGRPLESASPPPRQ